MNALSWPTRAVVCRKEGFNGHIDAFCISHVQRSDGWIETAWNNMSDPVRCSGRGRGAQNRGWRPATHASTRIVAQLVVVDEVIVPSAIPGCTA